MSQSDMRRYLETFRLAWVQVHSGTAVDLMESFVLLESTTPKNIDNILTFAEFERDYGKQFYPIFWETNSHSLPIITNIFF